MGKKGLKCHIRRDYNMKIDLKERAFEVMGSIQLAYSRY